MTLNVLHLWLNYSGDKSLKKREESSEKKSWAQVGQGNCVYHFID